MKKKIIFVALTFCLCLTSCGIANVPSTADKTAGTKEVSVATTTPTTAAKTIETIYADDAGINLFVSRYNELNEDKITADMLSKEHIGGRDRDDVVSVKNDKFEINIYDNYGSNEKYNMSVFVRAYRQQEVTPDEYKEEFLKFIKVFDNTLTPEELNNHWETILSDYHSSYKINDIDMQLRSEKDKIEYYKLTQNIEF